MQRCVERALVYGALRHSMTDRGHHAGSQGRLVSLACDKAKEHGYAHESWTTRLLARHAREHGPAAGHECLARLVQGTVCKILGQEEIKPHKVRYYRSPRRRRICRPSPACTRPSRGPLARAVCGAASSMGWPPQRNVPLLSDFDARSKRTGAR